jgi:hypothetical protein
MGSFAEERAFSVVLEASHPFWPVLGFGAAGYGPGPWLSKYRCYLSVHNSLSPAFLADQSMKSIFMPPSCRLMQTRHIIRGSAGNGSMSSYSGETQLCNGASHQFAQSKTTVYYWRP